MESHITITLCVYTHKVYRERHSHSLYTRGLVHILYLHMPVGAGLGQCTSVAPPASCLGIECKLSYKHTLTVTVSTSII